MRLLRAASIASLLLAAACASRPAVPPPNILLVTADSLRVDRVEALVEAGRLPAFARLAREGTSFPNAWTVAPWTAPSLVSILTGLEPPTHGVENRDDTTPSTLPTLPRRLEAAGFALANFGFFTGASYYRHLGLPEPHFSGGHERAAEAAARWIPGAGRPFFAWVHLVETHLPYGADGYEAPTPRLCGSGGLERAQVAGTEPLDEGWRFDAGDRERLVELYDEDLVRLDAAIGALLEALDRAGLAGKTVVALTADHGEELLDHGFVGHASTSGEAKLEPELLRVPLVLRGPGVPRGKSDGRLAQNLDLAPTLLALAGLGTEGGGQGFPLLADAPRRRFAFFSTTPGGHRTPDSRRNERLLGVTDGRRIASLRVGAAPRGEAPPPADLAAELDSWRRRQARARLALVSRYGSATRPDPAEVDSWTETLAVAQPPDGARLRWSDGGGTIRLAWELPADARGWIEYEASGGLLPLAGAFEVEGAGASFGPFPDAFWNDLAAHSPIRFRLLDPAGKRRSAWHRLELEPVAEGTR